MASRELKVEIIGDSRSLERALGRAGDSATGFGSKFAKAGKVVGLAALGVGAAVTAGFVYTLKRGFDELADSQKVLAQTAAGIKSTGGAANVTAKQVGELATSLSLMSGVDDEVIQQGENLLLTFTKVRNEVGAGNDIFNQATQAALDLSVKGFGSVDSASKMMGKALQDPIKGMTALGRAGVTFTAAQKETIKSLIESGHQLEAQKLILKEVETQVGGSAKAFGETLPGQLAKLRNAFDEVAGKLAEKFLPVLTRLVAWVNDHWPQIAKVFDTVGRAITATFEFLGPAIRKSVEVGIDVWDRLRAAAERAIGFVVSHKDAFIAAAGAAAGVLAVVVAYEALEQALHLATAAQLAFNIVVEANPYVLAATAVAALAGALVVLYVRNQQVHDAMVKGFNDIKATVMPAIITLEALWKRFGDTLTTVARTSLGMVVAIVQNYITQILLPFRLLLDVLGGQWGKAWKDLVNAARSPLNLVGTLLKGYATIYKEIAVALGKAVMNGLQTGLSAGWQKVVGWLGGLSGWIVSAVGDLSGALVGAGAALLGGLWDGISSKLGWLKDKVGAIKDKLTSWKGPVSADYQLWQPAGAAMVKGLGDRITQDSANLKAVAKNVGAVLVQGLISGVGEKEKDLHATLKALMSNPSVLAAIGAASKALGRNATLEIVKGIVGIQPTMAAQLKQALSDATKQALDAAKQKIIDQKAAFTSAFSTLADAALAAFDKKFASWVPPSMKKLLKMQAEDAAKSIQDALDEAQKAVEEATAKVAALPSLTPIIEGGGAGTPEERAAREAANAELAAAQAQLAAAQRAAMEAQLQIKADQEQAAHNARVAAARAVLEAELKRIGKNFGSLADASKDLADALREAIARVNSAGGGGGKQPNKGGKQRGGPVRRGMTYLVGEAGPEIFTAPASGRIIPNGRGATAGGLTVNLTVHGSVMTENDLIATVHDGLLRTLRSNGKLGF